MKTKVSQLTLHSALQQLQALHVAIRLTPRSVAIWSPNTRVPCLVRRAVKEHAREIRAMIQACRVEVCPSPGLHRKEWHFADPEWTADSAICGVCQRLAVISEVVTSRSNFDKIKVSTRAGSGIERIEL